VSIYVGASKFTLGARHAVMGSALHVPLGLQIEAGSTVKVTITYRTSKGSTALQWLAKEYIYSNFLFVGIFTRIVLQTDARKALPVSL